MTSSQAIRKPAKGSKLVLCSASVLAVLTVMAGAAVNMDRVGDSLLNQARFADAIPFYEVATSAQKLFGLENQRSANAWTDLGICYAREQRNADALRVQNIALEIHRNLLIDAPGSKELANH